MFAERGNKQQQQQFSHKESRWTRSKRSVHKSQMPKVAPKGTKHRPSSAALPAAVPHRPCRRAPPHPPPPQHPARRRMAAASSAVAPQSRRRASATSLRRPACASPTLSMRALPARAPCGRRLNPPSEPARGSSYRPRPLQRGAQQRHHRWLYQSFHPSLLVARGAPVISPSQGGPRVERGPRVNQFTLEPP
jgi:hypothetical protein